MQYFHSSRARGDQRETTCCRRRERWKFVDVSPTPHRVDHLHRVAHGYHLSRQVHGTWTRQEIAG